MMTPDASHLARDRFLERILALHPRVAVFDCDGTLWTNDSGMDFFYWVMDQGLVPPAMAQANRARYAEYKRGHVDEVTMCGEMAQLVAGLPVAVVEDAVRRFFPSVVGPNLFADMHRLSRRLHEQGCELWAVSSTLEFVVREGARGFYIPGERVIGARTIVRHGVIGRELLRVPSGPHKAAALRTLVGKPADAVFGNSVHDFAMLEMGRHAVAVNPTPGLERLANERDWLIYWPERILASR
jgi:phosphoserine phosphatase